MIFGEFLVRRCIRCAQIDGRIHQNLQGNGGTSCVASLRRNDSGHSTAGTVTGNHKPSRIDAQRRGVRGHPSRYIETVFERSRKLVLGSETIIDGNHNGSGTSRNGTTDVVVRLQIADHPAATMKVNDAGTRAATFGRIDPDRDLPSPATDLSILDICHGLGRAPQLAKAVSHLPGFRYGQGFHWRPAHRGKAFKYGTHVRSKFWAEHFEPPFFVMKKNHHRDTEGTERTCAFLLCALCVSVVILFT